MLAILSTMSSTDCHSSPSGIIVSPGRCQLGTDYRLGNDVSPDPGQLTPVQVTDSPFESTILRPSVLKGPYGHPDEEVFSARRGRKVMSRGCGVKAAALAEVTASAATQAIDLIVNAAMMLLRQEWIVSTKQITTSTPSHCGQYIYQLCISLPLYQWPSAPHGAGMWPAKLSTSDDDPFRLQQNLIFGRSGRQKPNLS